MDKSKRLKLVRNVLLLFPAAIGATLPAATLDWAPAHQKRLRQINALRRKYPVLMGTYRDTDGFENSNPKKLLARAFADGNEMAIVVCTAKDEAAEGVLRVPGRMMSSWDGIGGAKAGETAAGVGVSLPTNGLAVLAFRRISGNPTTNGNERSEAR